MKKLVLGTLLVLAAGFASAGEEAKSAGQYYQMMKPWTLSVGVPFWQGDHKDIGIESGFLAGLDYQYQGSSSNGSFLGVRVMLGESGGVRSRTMGIHYGATTSFGGPGGQNLYFKTAGGYYNSDVDGAGDEWGFGGFVAIGYAFSGTATGQGFTLEGGWFWAPSTGGVDNNGFYVAAGVRF